jgi:acetyl esterase/lipase
MTGILDGTSPPKADVVRYGSDPSQFAELRFPQGEGPLPVLIVIHGGFWSAAYDLQHISPFCAALTSYGIITCNLEYRRVGQGGGGWPGTLLDVANGAEHLRQMLGRDGRVDLRRAAAIGHSAGGHLALWLAGSHSLPKGSVLHTGRRPWLNAVISLAGIADLRSAWELQLGSGAVDGLIGGGPNRYPQRYSEASPVELLPMGLRQIVIHGRTDGAVPFVQSEGFVRRAITAGDDASLIPLEGTGHFELIDPESGAWDTVVGSVRRALKVG